MPRKKRSEKEKYPERLSDEEVIAVFLLGAYRLVPETGEVFGQQGTKIWYYFSRSTLRRDGQKRLFCRIYYKGARRAIAVSRLVWMVASGRTIPFGFEVHHYDENPENNAWSNLFCLSELDHRKLHNQSLVKEEEVPF